MGIKKSDGQVATYTGANREALSQKYPEIATGSKGVVTPRHKFEVEKDPTRPFMFYPQAWGYIYGFAVSAAQLRLHMDAAIQPPVEQNLRSNIIPAGEVGSQPRQ